MLVVRTQMDIGGFKFPYVETTETVSSWETLTDTCTITVPRKLRWGNVTFAKSEGLFRRGMNVTVQHGYGSLNDVKTVFKGHVAKGIKPSHVLQFDCEDDMWLLKKGNINKSYSSVTLAQLLADHIGSIPYQAADVQLGKFRIKNATLAQVLETLRKEYGLHSWFRNGTLYSGLAYWPQLSNTHVFTIGDNVIDHSDLSYVDGDDVKIKAKGISMLPNNTKIELELGDADGEQRTFHYYDLTQAELKARLQEDIDRRKTDGYTGIFLAFGEPLVQHGDIIDLRDPQGMVGRGNGSYLVKKVTYRGGIGGLRQVIQLDGRAAA